MGKGNPSEGGRSGWCDVCKRAIKPPVEGTTLVGGGRLPRQENRPRLIPSAPSFRATLAESGKVRGGKHEEKLEQTRKEMSLD